MAKFTRSIAILFSLLLIFSNFETQVEVEAAECKVLSGTWVGWCGSSDSCDQQCRVFEHYDHGSCVYEFPSEKCMCYYPC
ncbi:hypothetical protein ACHQM5_004184 [Ranunculus cassubicifolius]